MKYVLPKSNLICGKSVIHDMSALQMHFSNIGLEQNEKLIEELILVYCEKLNSIKLILNKMCIMGNLVMYQQKSLTKCSILTQM